MSQARLVETLDRQVFQIVYRLYRAGEVSFASRRRKSQELMTLTSFHFFLIYLSCFTIIDTCSIDNLFCRAAHLFSSLAAFAHCLPTFKLLLIITPRSFSSITSSNFSSTRWVHHLMVCQPHRSYKGVMGMKAPA